MKTIKECPCNDGLCCFFTDPDEVDPFGLRKFRYTAPLKKDFIIEFDIEDGDIIMHCKKYACKNLELTQDKNNECYFRCSIYKDREKMKNEHTYLKNCIDFPNIPGKKDTYLASLEGEIKNLKLYANGEEIIIPVSKRFTEGLKNG